MLYAMCVYIYDPMSSACSHHSSDDTNAPESCFDSREHDGPLTLALLEGDLRKCMFASTCNAGVNRSRKMSGVMLCAVMCVCLSLSSRLLV